MKVLVIQPTLPHYRAAFFRGVAAALGDSLEIHASPSIPGGPDSVPASELPSVRYYPYHRLRTIGHNRLYWQDGLSLDQLSRGDVLMFSGNPRFLSLFPLVLQAKAKGVGIIIHGHGWSSSSLALTARLRHMLWRAADVLLLYTDEERQQFIDRGYPATNVFATNNTIGTDDIKNAIAAWPEPQLAKFRAEQQSGDDCPLLLFCGRLTEKAQLHVLIDALAISIQAGRRLRLAIVGAGSEEAQLRARASRLNLDQQILWLGAIHDEAKLAPWFLSASLFIYPGAIGLSLLHSFNYGLPVVTHDQLKQHNPEIAALAPGENGALFPQGNAAALSTCIHSLLSNPSVLANMRAKALETVTTRFSTDLMVSRFLQAVDAAHRISTGSRGRDGCKD